MWFFTSVLVLWGSTAYYSSMEAWTVPPVVDWAWWTFHQYTVGAAALNEMFNTLATRVMGILGYMMFVLYYVTMSATYMGFLPTNADQPDMWPTIFLSVNLFGPILLASAGCLKPAMQGRG